MSQPSPLIQKIEAEFFRKDPLPNFRAGDRVRVHVKIREGEKERTQAFEGYVIRRSRGGNRATLQFARFHTASVSSVSSRTTRQTLPKSSFSLAAKFAKRVCITSVNSRAKRLASKSVSLTSPRHRDQEVKTKKRGAHRKARAKASRTKAE